MTRIKDYRKLCILLILLVAGFVTLGCTRAAAGEAISASDFKSLPDNDKLRVLVKALQEREKATANIKASFVTRFYNVEFSNGKFGKKLGREHPCGQIDCRYECELARKDGDYRMKVLWYVMEEPDRPTATVQTWMDTKSGVAKSIAECLGNSRVYGTIDTKPNGIIDAGEFFYWFDDAFGKSEDHPITFLLEKRDLIKFEGANKDGLVEISVSKHDVKRNYVDVQEFSLDPQKGFLPVRIHRYWEYGDKLKDGVPFFSNQTTQIIETEEIGGVWFPSHWTKHIVGRSSTAKGFASVHDTTVGKIVLGKVTDTDFELAFPAGTHVNDMIRGGWHVVGQEAPVQEGKD